jgi:hypothetical protein
MSHLPERKEKVCLNCRATLIDRYCHHCGQENLEPKESFWHLLEHFIEDLTHFDGKLFITIKYLLFNPGHLTTAYVQGKRVSYLNPIRMYLFISAMYFLLLMSLIPYQTNNAIQQLQNQNVSKNISVSNNVHITRSLLDSLDKENKDIKPTFEPKTIAQYDSVQNALPRKDRDNKIERAISIKLIKLEERAKGNKQEMLLVFMEKFAHSLPYLLFISVPLIALLFQLVYVRHKEIFYVSNVIFTIHFYCVYFITHIITECLDTMGHKLTKASLLISFICFAYLYIAMLNFYKQGWFKTLLKYFFVLLFGFLIFGILFMIDLVFSMWTIA